MSNALERLYWLHQQAAPLVKTDRFDIHPGIFRQCANCEVFCVIRLAIRT